MFNDDKWRVSVEGQINAPFDTHEEALDYAASMEAEGFECLLYFCAKGENDEMESATTEVEQNEGLVISRSTAFSADPIKHRDSAPDGCSWVTERYK